MFDRNNRINTISAKDSNIIIGDNSNISTTHDKKKSSAFKWVISAFVTLVSTIRAFLLR